MASYFSVPRTKLRFVCDDRLRAEHRLQGIRSDSRSFAVCAFAEALKKFAFICNYSRPTVLFLCLPIFCLLSPRPLASQHIIKQPIPFIESIQWQPVAVGGTQCVFGSGFGSNPGSVNLNGMDVAFLQWSDTQICFVIPPDTPATAVTLVISSLSDSTETAFTVTSAVPAISAIAPGSAGAGEPVAINGSNFGASQADSLLQIQGQNLNVVSWSDTQIVARAPTGITVPGAYTASVTVHGYTVSVPLTISAPSLDTGILSRIASVNAGRISSDIQTLSNFTTRSACAQGTGSSGIELARNFIAAQFSSLPGVHVSLLNLNNPCIGGVLQDVVAWIPGSGHPNRLIVIGGHYDSRTVNVIDSISPAPGANDSGSQTALVMEAARALAGGTYDATLVFASWTAEEEGLFGSAAFVQGFRTLFPNGAIEFNLNSDIVGGDNTVNTTAGLQQFRLFSPGTPREISGTAVGSTDNTSPSRLVMHYIGDWGGRYVPEMAMLPNLREDRPGRGSDHESFIDNSIPGVRFIETIEDLDHQHSPNDLFGFVTPGYTASIARVVIAMAASLAQAPTPPRSLAATLGPGTVGVSWLAPLSGPPVDHYVVAARPVTENFYRRRVAVSAAQSSTQFRPVEDLGLPPGSSFFISVAAVDAAGHESLFAYPEYRCSASCVVPAGALNVTATR